MSVQGEEYDFFCTLPQLPFWLALREPVSGLEAPVKSE